MLFLTFLLCIIMINLINIPLFTLVERKVLSYIQNRKGPKKVSFIGILQPISDGMKLLTKKIIFPLKKKPLLFFLSPIFLFFIMLSGFLFVPTFKKSFFFFEFSFLLFLCVSSLSVFFLLSSSWASKTKYSLIGCVRNCVQTISYEICLLTMIFFPCCLVTKNYKMTKFFFNNKIFFQLLMGFIFVIWVVLIMMETKRAPFDFAEGESELVSGFKIEYSSFSFALIFLAEYGNMMLISLLSSKLFFFFLKGLKMIFLKVLMFFFLVFRGAFPRFRIDLLSNFCWVVILPILIFFFKKKFLL